MPVAFARQGASGSRVRVVCYGDSLTAGFFAGGRLYAPYGRDMADVLAAAAGGSPRSAPAVSVCGHSGHTAKEMVSNLDVEAAVDVGGNHGQGLRRILLGLEQAGQRPGLALIMAGTNDLGVGRDPDAIFSDVRQLHLVCHTRGVRTVILTVPPAPRCLRGPWEDGRRRLNALLATWAATAAPDVAAVVDTGAVLLPPGQSAHLWDPDGLHFSAAGSRVLGHSLARGLAPLIQVDAAAVASAFVPASLTAPAGHFKAPTAPAAALGHGPATPTSLPFPLLPKPQLLCPAQGVNVRARPATPMALRPLG